jgi:formylglycine-generating enzyme required for sulfatase activity
MAATRNAGATYVIPSENEWYKAAYYKGGSTNAGYWLYPTKSDSMPSNVLSPTGTNNANFHDDNGTGNHGYTDPMNYLTSVGAFAASPGPCGTFDQGGDLLQWNETSVWNPNAYNTPDFVRGLRGGSFTTPAGGLTAYRYLAPGPTAESFNIGFRVAMVPEPGSLAMLAGAALAASLCWRRRRT